MRTHTLSHILKPHGPKPTHDEIAAYLDEALDEREMERVETHIRSNDHFLAVFDKLLILSMKLEAPLPSKESLEKLKVQLRGPRFLGRLRVFFTDRFKQVFHPARTSEPAHARALKMLAETDSPLPCMDATAYSEEKLSVCEDRALAPPPPPPGASNPRLIDTGRWLIRAVTSGRKGEAILELVIEDAKSGQPVPMIPVRLEPGWEDPVHARTDEKGSVRLPLPDGDSRLEIGKGPQMVLDINADLEAEQHQK